MRISCFEVLVEQQLSLSPFYPANVLRNPCPLCYPQPKRLAMHSTIHKSPPHSQLSSSLFPCHDHLLALATPLFILLLRMSSLILLSSLDRFELLVLDLTGLLHDLRYVSVALDAANFRPMATRFSNGCPKRENGERWRKETMLKAKRKKKGEGGPHICANRSTSLVLYSSA